MNPRPHPLLLAFDQEWQYRGQQAPTLFETGAGVVLPFSLIPPVMLWYAGAHHPTAYGLTTRIEAWHLAAGLFLVCELCCVPLMAVLISSITKMQGHPTTIENTFLLATRVAIPLWLSALVLAIPNAAIMVVALAWAFWTSVQRLHRGADSLLRTDDPFEVLSLTYTVFSSGLLVWALLLGLVIEPLMA